MPELWEKQPWETSGSFARFAAYYLAQTPPRSGLEAYRRFMAERNKPKPGVKSLPGTWHYWMQGRDSKGNTIPGAVGWRERADAFDAHQHRLAHERRQQELAGRMRAYDEAAMRVVERGIKVVERMLDFPLQETTIAQDGQRITIMPARWSMDTAAKLVPALDKLYRLLYSLPTEQIDATTRVQPGHDHLTDDQIDDEIAALMGRAQRAREAPEFITGAGAADAGADDSPGTSGDAAADIDAAGSG